MYTIYGQPGCPYCERAKTAVMNRYDYEYIDISDSAAAQFYIKETLGAKTVPQIFLDGEYIGGYENLMVHLSSQEFDQGDLF